MARQEDIQKKQKTLNIFIVILLAIYLIEFGVLTILFPKEDKKTAQANTNGIKSSTVYSSNFINCNMQSIIQIDESKLQTISETSEVIGKYINEDIKNGTKPQFADEKYNFANENNGIKFDLGGGFSYYSLSDKTSTEYSCYQKYQYSKENNKITLSSKKNNKYCQSKQNIREINLINFNQTDQEATLTIDFDGTTETFTSKINNNLYQSNRDVSGTYELSYICSTNTNGNKKITEKIILNTSGSGYYYFNDKKTDIKYYIIRDTGLSQTEDYMIIYSKNESLYLRMQIQNQYLIESSKLAAYGKTKP